MLRKSRAQQAVTMNDVKFINVSCTETGCSGLLLRCRVLERGRMAKPFR